MASQDPILEIKDLAVEFKTDKGTLRAVDRVGLTVHAGETVGVVGESGCGKSVTSLAVLGLIPSPPGKIVEGEILFGGRDLTKISNREYRKLRGREISMIFQEPMTALNPVLKIGTQICDVIGRHKGTNRSRSYELALEMLEKVGIPVPEKRIEEFPHQLSGGMRQRVMIAMALACDPKLLLADEPTTALDVTTQAQVMAEMAKLQKSLGMSVVLVTHDLGVVAETCDRVVVMYCGQVIEEGPVDEIFKQPQHPYTKGLINSVPLIREHKLDRLPTIDGVVPDLSQLPEGCRFADRCFKATPECRRSSPTLRTVKSGVNVACYHPAEDES